MKNARLRDDKMEERISLLLFLICRASNGALNVALTNVHGGSTSQKCRGLTLNALIAKPPLKSQFSSETFLKRVTEILKEKYTLAFNEAALFPIETYQKSQSPQSGLQKNSRVQAFLAILPECDPLFFKKIEGIQSVALEDVFKGSPRIEDSHRKILEEGLSQYPREIFRAKYSKLKFHPRALSVMKLPIPVKVLFVTSPGTLTTKEGCVTYTTGDALLTGIEGESWPVQRSSFEETYEPMQGTLSGSPGLYVKKPVGVWAIQLDHAEEVWIGNGESRLHGEKGDWLVEYSGGRFGVVSQDIFRKTYQILPTPSQ